MKPLELSNKKPLVAESGKSPVKVEKAKAGKNLYDKDDEFDMLLNDFKNYQIGSSKKEQPFEEDEWF